MDATDEGAVFLAEALIARQLFGVHPGWRLQDEAHEGLPVPFSYINDADKRRRRLLRDYGFFEVYFERDGTSGWICGHLSIQLYRLSSTPELCDEVAARDGYSIPAAGVVE